MFLVRSHPAVSQFMPGSPPANFLQHTQYLYNVKNKLFFIVYEEETPCGYAQCTFSGEEIELGWALHPDYWGKGIGTTAVQQLVDVIAAHNKRIVLYVQKNNPRALAIYQKQGFSLLEKGTDEKQYKMELVHANRS